jgi:hypothetical protein
MAISDLFQVLKDRIQPSTTELANLGTHAGEIKAALKSDGFDLTMKTLGSHARETAISKYSDLDQFAIIARDDAKWGDKLKNSNTVLSNFKTALKNRFTNTDIGKDGQALVLPFSDGTEIDVVPAIFETFTTGQTKRPIYKMPNGKGGWLLTSPEAHNAYITDKHEASRHKFKYVIQMLKFWRATRVDHIPLSSFYLELLFAREQTFSEVKSYAQCVYDAFDLLQSRRGQAVRDPLGISGDISMASTPAKIESTVKALIYAKEKAAKAIEAENNRDGASAREFWNMVFNGKFPSR